MTKNSQDEFARAHATLSALRENIEQLTKANIEETFVNKFHSALDKLAGIGIDVSEFRIPDSEIAPTRTNLYVTGPGVSDNPIYSKEKYVNKPYFLTQIGTVISYLDRITAEKPKRIGFRTSQD